MSRFKINEVGYWECSGGEGHVHDKSLCVAITSFLKNQKIKKVVDFGCGMGDYARHFIENEISCDAYDGNPNTKYLTGGIGEVLDLSQTFNLNKSYDLVLSLEVGEHIPKEFEQIFINNLCAHSNQYILLSWAVVGQGGDGHVNCQNNEYIIDEMASRGYSYVEDVSLQLRESVTNAGWFRNTVMLFKK